MLHQEVDAVFFKRNRKRVGLGNGLHYLHIADVEFVAAGGTLIGTHFAGDDHARFLGKLLDRVEHLRRNRVLRHHALDHAGAVTKDRKQQLAALAQVVEPSADGDGLAIMLADLANGGDWRLRRGYVGGGHDSLKTPALGKTSQAWGTRSYKIP